MPSPAGAKCAALGLDAAFLRRVRDAARQAGIDVAEAAGAGAPEVAAADVVLAGGAAGSPQALLDAGARAVVACVAQGDTEGAARALASGADDVVTPRTGGVEVAARLDAAVRRRRLQEAQDARRRLDDATEPRLLGRSAAIVRVMRLVEPVGAAHAPVRIDGERGTGRTVLARTLHAHSAHRGGPLVVVDADRLGPAARGALLGDAQGCGALRAAVGGSVVVRSVDRLDSATQLDLARHLRRGSAEGAARVLVTSVEPLDALAARGAFRSDLAAALAPLAVRMPPLRERPGDAPLLLEHFVAEAVAPDAKPPALDDAARRVLDRHAWPGNVAEVRALATLLAVRAGAVVLGEPELLPLLAFPHPRPAGPAALLAVATLEELTRAHVFRVLALAGGVRTRAAKALGISPRTLYNHLHGHDPEGSAPDDPTP